MTDSVVDFEWDGLPVSDDYASMNLKAELRQGISEFGLEEPSAIEKCAISPLLQGRDVWVAGIHSGIEKVATLAIPILQKVDTSSPDLQVLVIFPARELAQNVSQLVAKLGAKILPPVNVYVVVGGTSVREDTAKLRRKGMHIVCGTPGRIVDMVNRGALKPDGLKAVYVDEADELLGRGFKDQLNRIFKFVCSKHDVQTVLLTASRAPGGAETLEKLLRHEPLRICAKADSSRSGPGFEGVSQYFVEVDNHKKLESFTEICNQLLGWINEPDKVASEAGSERAENFRTVIFCKSRRKVDTVFQKLRDQGFKVASVHSKGDERGRATMMTEFRAGLSPVLVTTESLARDLDVREARVIINYDLPETPDSYTLRVARSMNMHLQRRAPLTPICRFVAINFVTEEEKSILSKIMTEWCHVAIEELAPHLEYLIQDLASPRS